MNYSLFYACFFAFFLPLLASAQIQLSSSSGWSMPIPGYNDPDLTNKESMGAKNGAFLALNVEGPVCKGFYFHFMGALSLNDYEIYNSFYSTKGRYSPVYLMLGGGYEKQWNKWSLRLMADIGAVGLEDIHQELYADRFPGPYSGEVLEERQFQSTWGIVYGAQVKIRYAIAENWHLGTHIGILNANKIEVEAEWVRYEDNNPFPGPTSGVITKEFEPSILFLALELAYEF